MKRPSIADQVERQQEAQHTEGKEPDVNLEDDISIRQRRGLQVLLCVSVGLCPHPEWISSQRSHHGQKQGLLQESKNCTDQRLHPSQTAEL